MFGNLVTYYLEYREERGKLPYNGDKVQALGLRFADEWNACKQELMKHFSIPEEEFDYSLHHTLMPKLTRG